jgi:hypothetical protein
VVEQFSPVLHRPRRTPRADDRSRPGPDGHSGRGADREYLADEHAREGDAVVEPSAGHQQHGDRRRGSIAPPDRQRDTG